MKQCNNCGSTFDDSAMICGYCGNKLDGAQQIPQSMPYQPVQQQPQSMPYQPAQQQTQGMPYQPMPQPIPQMQLNMSIPQQPVKEKKPVNKKAILIGVSVFLLLAIAGVVVYLLLTRAPKSDYYVENFPKELLEYSINGEEYTSEIADLKIVKEKKDGNEVEAYCEIVLEDEWMTRTLYYTFEVEREKEWKIEEYTQEEEDEIVLKEEYAEELVTMYQVENISNYQVIEDNEPSIFTFSYDVDDEYELVTLEGTAIFEAYFDENTFRYDDIDRRKSYTLSFGISDDSSLKATWDLDGSYACIDDDGKTSLGMIIDSAGSDTASIEIYSKALGEDYSEVTISDKPLFDSTGALIYELNCESMNSEIDASNLEYILWFYADEVYYAEIDHDDGFGVFEMMETEFTVEEPEVEEPVVENTETVPLPSMEGDVIHVYSFNHEFGSRLDVYFRANYPEYSDKVIYHNLNMLGLSEEYFQAIEEAMNSDEVPSIVVYDIDAIDNLSNRDIFVPVSSIGITDTMYANAYDYTKKVATFDGELMGLTYQAFPGCFVYDPAIAQEIFGHSDPESVNSLVVDWDTFLETAAILKEHGYYMVADVEDITTGAGGEVPQYVIDEVLANGYSAELGQWSSEWYSYPDNVFGYFGCPWFVQWSIGSMGLEKTISVCEGPRDFYWGGSYVGVTNACTNPELAAFVMYTLCCDNQVMYDMYVYDYEYPNNTVAVQQLIYDGYGALDILGGQNPLPTYDAVGQSIVLE